MAGSLATLSVLTVLVWRASVAASAYATFNLPVLSSQPWMVIHALVPVPGCAVAVCTRRRVIRPNLPTVGIASSKTG